MCGVRGKREGGGGGLGWLYDWRELSDAMRGSFGGRGSLAFKTPQDELGWVCVPVCIV